ncbi:MAG: hypothetical protein AAF702_29705 [Chloroflexota bacterium]
MDRGSSKSTLIIAHALLHAGAILLASYLLRETGQHQAVTYLILALWFASSLLLFEAKKSLQCEVAYIRRLFSTRERR